MFLWSIGWENFKNVLVIQGYMYTYKFILIYHTHTCTCTCTCTCTLIMYMYIKLVWPQNWHFFFHFLSTPSLVHQQPAQSQRVDTFSIVCMDISVHCTSLYIVHIHTVRTCTNVHVHSHEYSDSQKDKAHSTAKHNTGDATTYGKWAALSWDLTNTACILHTCTCTCSCDAVLLNLHGLILLPTTYCGRRPETRTQLAEFKSPIQRIVHVYVQYIILCICVHKNVLHTQKPAKQKCVYLIVGGGSFLSDLFTDPLWEVPQSFVVLLLSRLPWGVGLCTSATLSTVRIEIKRASSLSRD